MHELERAVDAMDYRRRAMDKCMDRSLTAETASNLPTHLPTALFSYR